MSAGCIWVNTSECDDMVPTLVTLSTTLAATQPEATSLRSVQACAGGHGAAALCILGATAAGGDLVVL